MQEEQRQVEIEELSPPRGYAHDLFLLRNVLIAGECGALAIPFALLDFHPPWLPLVLAIGAQLLLNLVIFGQLRRNVQLRDEQLCGQLIVDLVALTVVLFMAGGTANPFADLYFVPLAFAAAALPWRLALLIAALTSTAHTLVSFYANGMEIPTLAANQTLWLASIYVSDFLTAAMIAYVVYKAATSLRRHEQLLSRAREKELHSQQLVQLGALATGAAHELGSPLSTVAVIARDLQHHYKQIPALCEDLKIISSQVDVCKESLSTLLATTGSTRVEGGGRVAIDTFLRGLVNRWKTMRPGTQTSICMDGCHPAPEIVADLTLEQALINLLNNAADVSPHDVALEAHWDTQRLRLRITDRGPGIDSRIVPQVGRPFFTTKGRSGGRGLGVFLTATTIQRFGGRFTLGSRPEGGAVSEVMLPLAKLTITEPAAHERPA